MKAFLFSKIHFLLGRAWIFFCRAIAAARTRPLWLDATGFTPSLVYRLRDALRRKAVQAVRFARAAYLLLTVEVLRSHYQLELFAL